MTKIVRLASAQATRPVRACVTCRFLIRSAAGPLFYKCEATAMYAGDARRGECNGGALWEAKPPRIGILVALKRWLVG